MNNCKETYKSVEPTLKIVSIETSSDDKQIYQ